MFSIKGVITIIIHSYKKKKVFIVINYKYQHNSIYKFLFLYKLFFSTSNFLLTHYCPMFPFIPTEASGFLMFSDGFLMFSGVAKR